MTPLLLLGLLVLAPWLLYVAMGAAVLLAITIGSVVLLVLYPGPFLLGLIALGAMHAIDCRRERTRKNAEWRQRQAAKHLMTPKDPLG